eukprot:comp13605_c0_seq1/m.9211 comp13605_c0_seq1/g.9211  ORF comp13605_c0_seq1/g.9211 comp13605_c0_seq1/m.9211 type:complete len:325 (-) comp13605_c0_seq1:333-1307(-)
MSPPCQPYTRLGQQRDMADPRAKALLHLCSLLQQMKRPPTYFLLENVYGFDQSDSRQVLLHTLASVGYQVQEFLLQPWQFGIPNERLRYYCLAVRAPAQPLRPHQGDVPQPLDHIPGMDMPRWRDAQVPSYPRQAEGIPTQTYSDFDKQRGACYYWCPTLREYLSTNQPIESGELDAPTNDDYSVPLRELANANSFVFDIVSMDSRISACFTRGYGKHYRGSGSFLSPVLHTDAAHITPSSDRFIEDLQALKLRRFSPMEVATLQGLPPPQAAGREPSARGHFSFPPGTTAVGAYKLLGNGINTKVVATLLAHLWGCTWHLSAQ